MQDRYAGDIGDYGKFALLRAMEAQQLKVGVNWYLTRTQLSEIHNDGKCRIPAKYEGLDPVLSAALNSIFDSPDARSVHALEQAALLACDHYVHEFVPQDPHKREDWHRRSLAALSECDIVFLDPDNGMNVKSVKPGSRKSIKYVWLCEISAYVSAGKSVIFYNHRPHKKASVYFAEYAARFDTDPALKGRRFRVITFPRRSVRDYYIIPASQVHEEKILKADQRLTQGPFGHSCFCFFQPPLYAFDIK